MIGLSFVGLVGCSTPSNTPTAYDETVESNFIDGCTATAPPASTDATGESLGQGASNDYCQCAYSWFVENVPYSDETTTTSEGQSTTTVNPAFANLNFKSINSDLVEDPNSMPQEIVTAIAQECGSATEDATQGTGDETTDTESDSSSTTSVPG